MSKKVKSIDDPKVGQTVYFIVREVNEEAAINRFFFKIRKSKVLEKSKLLRTAVLLDSYVGEFVTVDLFETFKSSSDAKKYIIEQYGPVINEELDNEED